MRNPSLSQTTASIGGMMKAGEYVGADRRTYRWAHSPIMGWILRDEGGCVTGAKPLDWPAAKAALDALIESEQEQWVELSSATRISQDGRRAQQKSLDTAQWVDMADEYARVHYSVCSYRKGREVALQECSDHYIGKSSDLYEDGYRKGREVAESEHEALRKQVRALVEAANDVCACVPRKFQRLESLLSELSVQL